MVTPKVQNSTFATVERQATFFGPFTGHIQLQLCTMNSVDTKQLCTDGPQATLGHKNNYNYKSNAVTVIKSSGGGLVVAL